MSFKCKKSFVTYNVFNFACICVGNITVNTNVDGSHAGGLDYVPFDGYIAELHKGEMVLTSAEAATYRKGEGPGKQPKIVNLTINTKSLTQADVEMLLDLVNRKLGDDL